MNNHQTDIHDGEIDLLELMKVIWDKKRTIVTFIVIATIISIIYAMTLPNIYQAEALLSCRWKKCGDVWY